MNCGGAGRRGLESAAPAPARVAPQPDRTTVSVTVFPVRYAIETTVLWDLPVDRTHYVPGIFPAGTLSPLKVMTTRAEIAYYGAATCQSSLNTTTNPGPQYHNIAYGISNTTSGDGSSSGPTIGNTRWVIRTWGANPSSPGGYGIGLTKIAAGIKLGAGACHVYNSFDLVAFNFSTDAEGINVQTIPIPNIPSLLGLWTYWQSVVADATATNQLGITFSDGVEAKFGDWTYTDY